MAETILKAIPEVKKMTVLEQIKKLDEQRAQLLGNAKIEALASAEKAVADLNSLGFSYRLVEGDAAPAKKTKQTRQLDPTKPCSVCKFATEPNHDARRHRSQGEKKKPFTEKELAELGYKKK
jgi:hypothetical protein